MKTISTQGRAQWLGRWMLALLVLVAGAMFALSPRPAHAAPAAGTVIGNQATATYVDAGSVTRTATSNLVQTTVSQVKSFTLDTNGQTRTAAPGQTVYYPHYITNTGNGTDTYTLNAPTSGNFGASAFVHGSLAYYLDANGDGVPDNATPISTSGPLAAGGIFRFVVAGTVPGGVTSPDNVATLTVSATDTTPTTRTNTNTTTVANSVVTVSKALSQTSGAAGVGPIMVTLSYTNSGTAAASNLTITDALPAGMTYVAGSGRWSVSGTQVLTDAADGAESGAASGVNFSVSGSTVTAVVSTVNAGVSGNVTFQVNIASGLAPQTINNTAAYTTTTQTTSANTNTASYTVLQTASVAFNGSATSSTASGAGVNDPLVIASAGASQTITYDNYVWNTGNASDTFDITTVSSNFPAGTSVQLFQQDGVTTLINSSGSAAPDTGPIPGRNATCNAPFVSVGGVCGYRVVVRVTLPATPTGGGPYNLVLRATSVFNNTVNDDQTDTLTTIAQNFVDVTNDVVSPTVAGNGEGAGTTAVIRTEVVTPSVGATTTRYFMVWVRNEGAVADTFNLTATFAATNVAGVTPPTLPAGWSVAFRSSNGTDCSAPGGVITATNALAPNAGQLVCAGVTIPATTSGTATPGNYDFDFTAASQTNGTVTDFVRDRITVNLVRSISLTPNNTQQTFAGSSVTYNHTIANTGNAADTASFAASCLADSRSGQGWTSTAYIDANANGTLEVGTDTLINCGSTNLNLAVNESRTVFVRVFAPGSAQGTDPANVTTLTATYSVTVSATDTTSVTDGLLLTKEQVALADPAGCNNANPSGYTQNAIGAGPNTAPGSCIAYRITATNTTAATISNVVVSDIIPANTRMRYSCSGNGLTTPSVWVGGTQLTGAGQGITQSVADNGTGTLRATIPTLTSTQSATLYFCVRIDP